MTRATTLLVGSAISIDAATACGTPLGARQLTLSTGSPATVIAICASPGTHVLTATADTYVHRASPGVNFDSSGSLSSGLGATRRALRRAQARHRRQARRRRTSATDGLVALVPSENTTVGTVWLPPFTLIT